ncbi:mutS domain I protein [Clostridium sp. CAG:575]|nr:mutS domain I protein [Clostridium sp. CAG:575]
MSKLLTTYTNLKKQDNETFYLFKIGLFYNFINEDASIMSNLLHLKITNLSPAIIKCGFPNNSFDKYIKVLLSLPYKIKIIDSLENNTLFELKNFETNKKIKEFIFKISEIDVNNISITEAYSLLEDLQEKAQKLLQ